MSYFVNELNIKDDYIKIKKFKNNIIKLYFYIFIKLKIL